MRLRKSFANRMTRLRFIAVLLAGFAAYQYLIIANLRKERTVATPPPSPPPSLLPPSPLSATPLQLPPPPPPLNVTAALYRQPVLSPPVRVACLIPYIGRVLPSWFDAFASTAYTSAELFDFLIFVTKAPVRDTPPNVKMIRIDEQEFFRRIVNLDVHKHSARHLEWLQKVLTMVLVLKPYNLVEVKPALGTIFADYLLGYSHWAIADLDILVGRMTHLITPQLLLKYDIYSSSFGDSHRFYLRGQLTVHRNDPYINTLWQHCDHLKLIGEKLADFAKSDPPRWAWMSSEGCYSKAVLDHGPKAKIVVATTQLSAFGSTLANKETFMLGTGLLRCYERPLDRTRVAAYVRRPPLPHRDVLAYTPELLAPGTADGPPGWHAAPQESYTCLKWFWPQFRVCLNYSMPATATQVAHEREVRYRLKTGADGDDDYAALGSCREGAITHFQKWKSNYRVFTARPPPPDAHGMLITETGFIPFKMDPAAAESAGWSYAALQRDVAFGTGAGAGTAAPWVPFGRVTVGEVVAVGQRREAALARGRGWVLPRLLGPRRGGAAGDAPDDPPTAPPSSASDSPDPTTPGPSPGPGPGPVATYEGMAVTGRHPLATAYCVAFGADPHNCTCPIHGAHIEVVQAPAWTADTLAALGCGAEPRRDVNASAIKLARRRRRQGAPRGAWLLPSTWVAMASDALGRLTRTWSRGPNPAPPADTKDAAAEGAGAAGGGHVTLVTVGWDVDYHGGHMDAMLRSWCGPKVVVLARLGSVPRTPHARPAPRHDDVTLLEVEVDTCAAALHPRSRGPRNNNNNNNNSNTSPSTADGGGPPADAATAASVPVLPHHTLFNIGLDAAGTDYVCLAPPGVVFPPIDPGGAFLRQLRRGGAGSRWGGRGTAAPVALVVPIYTAPPHVAEATARAGLEAFPDAGRRRNVPDPASVALNAEFGVYETRRDPLVDQAHPDELDDVRVAAVDTPAAAAATDMLPVVFNVAAGAHGAGFVRLPEELNGLGCRGATVLHVLRGAGYALKWANESAVYDTPAAATTSTTTLQGGEGEGEGPWYARARACLGRPAGLGEFARDLQTYHTRAAALRQGGPESLYYPRPFGERAPRKASAIKVDAAAANAAAH